MAILTALSELKSVGGAQLLKQTYAGMLENVQRGTLSSLIKNTDLSGDPSAGTMVAKRFQNTESKAYGTARTGGSGQVLVSLEVPISIDTDKELINEIELKDIKFNTVDGVVSKKAAQNEKSMKRELDRAFFAKAEEVGTEMFTAETEIGAIFDAMVKPCKTVENEYVDGVDVEDIFVTMDTDRYDAIRNKVDSLDNANISSDIASIGRYHGYLVAENLRQSAQFIVQRVGSIAQPVWPTLDDADKIPMSQAYHFGLFFSYGTKDVAPDTIFVKFGYTLTSDVAIDTEKTYYTKSDAIYTAVASPVVGSIGTYYERD